LKFFTLNTITTNIRFRKIYNSTNNLKVPSGLKKKEIIQYLMGIIQERNNGIQEKNINTSLDVLQPRRDDIDLDWLVYLHKYGWP